MMRPEQALQQAAVELLGYALPRPPEGPFWFAPDPGIAVTLGKGMSEAEKTAARLHAKRIGGIKKSMGVVAGVPDLVFLWNTDERQAARGSFGVEFKSVDGTTSTEQLQLHSTLNLVGVRTYIVRSLEQLRAALEAEHIRLRASF